ncbi:MAG: molybdopterin molybdotransferase MoeA, partial [Candidatus Latescibacter sp.]|nr:molybdopterin molybdotransferase MoeA [Candidatus Latescibacter sp.]
MKIVLDTSAALPAERMYIADTVGMVLAENIFSKIPMPPFHKSAVDGYALKAAQAESAGVLLTCTGLIQAGETFGKEIKPGECIKIMTGAAVPLSTDSVIMVEDTHQLEDGMVEMLKSVKKGQNICVKGEDIASGQRVLEKGTLISSSHVAVMAASGRKSIKVYGKPEVAILNTGGEIVPVGRKITGNRIYNSNGPML